MAETQRTDGGISRRRMLGYLVAGPTLIAAASWKTPTAGAAIPTHQIYDSYDASDMLTDAARPTNWMLTVTVNPDGTASFDLPRAEVGQGITTAIAMAIADEMELPLDKVRISLSDARPELLWNQMTASSNTMHSLYEPVRMAAAAARDQTLQVAADEWHVMPSELRIRDGVIRAPDGRTTTYGALAERAAVTTTRVVRPRLKSRSQQQIVGTEQRRRDGRAIVTGRKVFAMDLDVAGALPTMICRAPTINGSAVSVRNLTQVRGMPGVTDVVTMPHDQHVQGGVAVRARTFGQCIDAIRALSVTWAPGPAAGKSDASVLADLRKAEIPLTPALPGRSIEEVFTFHFRPGDPLEPNCAVADVRSDSAEIWGCFKTPIWIQQQIASKLGLPQDAVTVHVTEGGGSFGRHLFGDAGFEAAAASRLMGKPVKLMWHRTDSFRHGRAHPMCTSRVRITYSGNEILAFDQRHTSVATDLTHGIGELLTAMHAAAPGHNYGYARTLFTHSVNVPYNFGAVTQELNEIYEFNAFNTSSVRNVYNPDVATATELMVDQLAGAMGKDAVALRLEFAKDDRMRAVIEKVRDAGRWGRPMAAGTGQGLAIHDEYKGRAACLVELDCRPATVERKVRHGYTGPRVTKVVLAVDVGLPINPLGIKAQMMGGVMDGIAQALSYSLHLKDGYFLEGSWDDAFYTRQWNTPGQLEIIVMPPTTGVPGGAGELGVPIAMAAIACAYARATRQLPTSFPLNHHEPLGFEPFPTVPPIPQSPRNRLRRL